MFLIRWSGCVFGYPNSPLKIPFFRAPEPASCSQSAFPDPIFPLNEKISCDHYFNPHQNTPIWPGGRLPRCANAEPNTHKQLKIQTSPCPYREKLFVQHGPLAQHFQVGSGPVGIRQDAHYRITPTKIEEFLLNLHRNTSLPLPASVPVPTQTHPAPKRAVFGLTIIRIHRERLAGRLAHLMENQKGLGGTPPKPLKFLEPAWILELQTC
jgi:hypothetical protein